MNSAEAWEMAAWCAVEACRSRDPELRSMLILTRDHWIDVANELTIFEPPQRVCAKPAEAA
jgi:hypothetical protein